MDGKPMEAMTRIANNVPAKMNFGRVETRDQGAIYIAWGRGSDRWYGLWGSDYLGGVAATVEFKADSTEGSVKQALLDLGYNSVRELDAARQHG